MEAADESVGELARGDVVADPAVAERLVVGVGAGEPRIDPRANCCSASASRRLRAWRARTLFLLPDALVIGEVPA